MTAGCAGQMIPAATLLGSPGQFEDAPTEYTGRFGAQINRMEIGGAIHCWPEEEKMGQAYGIYILQPLTDPNGLWLLGEPYVGFQTTTDISNDSGMYAFITGTVQELGGIEILTEFQWRSYSDSLKATHDDSKGEYLLSVGPRFLFPQNTRP